MTNILCENRRFRKVTNRWKPLREWVLCEIASFSDCIIWHWLQHVNVKGQEHSQFGRKASNEKCTMDSILFRIQYHYNSQKYVTLTFDIWPWLLSLTLTLMYDLEIDILLHWCFKEKNCNKINVWRHVTQKRYFVRNIGDNNPDRYFCKEH